MSVGRALEVLHGSLARSVLASRLYLAAWSFVLRSFNDSRWKQRIVRSIMRPPWPACRVRTVSCCVGGSQRVRLTPHPGMMDFEALFSRTLNHEPEVFAFLDEHMALIDNVIDIGSNVGLFTLHMAHHLAARGPGRVHAFEPAPPTYRALLDNLAADRVKNVEPMQVAVADRDGTATLYVPTVSATGRGMTRSSLIEAHARFRASEVLTCTVRTAGPSQLEPILASGGRVLIKMDIEGAEKIVLRALEPLLVRYKPDVVLEALLGDCEALNSLSFLPTLYRFFHLTGDGPVEMSAFVGDPTFRFRDYFLTARSRTADPCW